MCFSDQNILNILFLNYVIILDVLSLPPAVYQPALQHWQFDFELISIFLQWRFYLVQCQCQQLLMAEKAESLTHLIQVQPQAGIAGFTI